MAEPKTKPTDVDPRLHIEAVADGARREEALRLMALFSEVSGEPATMWGPSIIGFGQYLAPAGKRFNPWPLTGFAVQKDKYSLYLMGAHDSCGDLFERLGKYKRGTGCVYVRKLADIDIEVLRDIISRSLMFMKSRFSAT